MKLIIDIPDNVYSYITKELSGLNDDDSDSIILHLAKGVLNGVVLGHESMWSAYCSRCVNFPACKSTLPEGHMEGPAYKCCRFETEGL